MWKLLKLLMFGEEIKQSGWFKQDHNLERFMNDEKIPLELVKARLKYSESRVVSPDRCLYGDIDQGIINEFGQVVLVYTKRRNTKRLDEKDRVQLSAYAWILKQRGQKVASYGFVRLVSGRYSRKVDYVKVALMQGGEITRLINEYQYQDSKLIA